MKYIIFNGYLCEEPVIFSSLQSHDQMAERLSQSMGKPVSAGFIDLLDGEMSAMGKSTSLGINSRPQDSEIIDRFFCND
jgi:hypothetical protein